MPRGTNQIIDDIQHTIDQRDKQRESGITPSDSSVLNRLYTRPIIMNDNYAKVSFGFLAQAAPVTGNPDFPDTSLMYKGRNEFSPVTNDDYGKNSINSVGDKPHPKGPNISVGQTDLTDAAISREPMHDEIVSRIKNISSDGYGSYDDEGVRNSDLYVVGETSSNDIDSSRDTIARYFERIHYSNLEDRFGDSTPKTNDL